MHQLGQGVHLLAVDEDVELDQVAGPIIDQLVIERPVALGHGFQLVVEIVDDLGQRQFADELDAAGHGVVVLDVLAAPLHAQGHDHAHVALRDVDGGLDERLLHPGDGAGVREVGGVVDLDQGLILQVEVVLDRGHGEDEGDVELALEPLLHHLQVEQAKEAAAKAEAERRGRVLLESEGGIVELELFQGAGQILVVVRGHRVERGEHHLLDLLEAGQGGRGRPVAEGDGVARTGVGNGLHPGDDVADLAGGQLLLRFAAQAEDAQFLHPVVGAVGHEQNLVPGFHRAVDDAHRDDRAAVGVVVGVEDERLQRRFRVTLGRRQELDDGVEQFGHALAGLGRAFADGGPVQAEILFDLGRDLVRLGRRQVDLVDHRDDVQVVFHGQVEVGQGLGLDPLGGVDEQQGALAGTERPGHLVAEVDMAGRVHQVEGVMFAVVGLEG